MQDFDRKCLRHATPGLCGGRGHRPAKHWINRKDANKLLPYPSQLVV